MKLQADKQKLPRRSKSSPVCHKWLYSLVLGVFLAAQLCLLSCASPPSTDVRGLAPAETLIFAETSNLAQTLRALTDNKSWEASAAEPPDFSQLENVQAAISVTGFAATENQLSNEAAILNLKPNLVLIADTHAWQAAAVEIVETQIGKFARSMYGDDVKLERSEKNDAKIFVWTSSGGRRLFSAVSGSVIYVGNDESLLDKCLDVRRGEAESLLKNEELALARSGSEIENRIAFGYVSPQGIRQIAALTGVSVAVGASEDDSVRSFVAGVLPDVLQKAAREIVWTAHKTERGIEDKIEIKTAPEISAVLSETIVPAPDAAFQAAQFLPFQFDSVTRYSLQNPRLAWQSLLSVTSEQMDAASGRMLKQFSNAFFEPYGIFDGEMFLSAVGTEIVTARFDEEGDSTIVVAAVKDPEKVKKSISAEIDFKSPPKKIGAADVWQSEDDELSAAFFEGVVILGEKKSVQDCLEAGESGKNFAKTIQFQQFTGNPGAASTITRDTAAAQKIIRLLGTVRAEKTAHTSFSTTRTRLVENGIERASISDFGLLGTIIEKLGGDN